MAPHILLFLLVSAAVGFGQQEKQLAVLEGTAINSATKEPILKAQVTLELESDAHDSSLVATTDEIGHFRFADVQPGRYQLTVEKAGFLDGEYGRKKLGDEGKVLSVAAGDRLQDLTLLLFPGGVISGRVLDADGDPVPEHEVLLWAREPSNGEMGITRRGGTKTDREGRYRVEPLLPGAYFVSISAGDSGMVPKRVPVDRSGKPTRVRYLMTYYPATVSLEEAQAVHVESGQEQAGIDIRVQRRLTLRVKGRIEGINGSQAEYSVSAVAGAEGGRYWEPGKTLPNGEFEFVDLPPGKHKLMLFQKGANGPRQVGETDISLTDQDVTGVVITRFKLAQVRVRMVMEDERDNPQPSGLVSLIPLEKPLRQQFGVLREGVYGFDDVVPGRYRVWPRMESGSYLKSVQSGGGQISLSSLDVPEGAMIDLVVTFSRNVARVEGKVEFASGQAGESAHVVLFLKDGAAATPNNYHWPRLDQTGGFSIGDLGPGKYLAFAMEDDDNDLWHNRDFVTAMESDGIEVKLEEKEHATIHLNLIPKDETDAVRKRLGL